MHTIHSSRPPLVGSLLKGDPVCRDRRQTVIGQSLVLMINVALLYGAIPISSSWSQEHWKMYAIDRPALPKVVPGALGGPPSDAMVLLDGKDLSQWRLADGLPANWKLQDDYAEAVPRNNHLISRQSFGDLQLHVEFMINTPVTGEKVMAGNGGIVLMGLYEIQIHDAYGNPTYVDGGNASLYGQHAPLVNVSVPPDQWQIWDIVFRRPRFDDKGQLTEKGTLTMFHSGVLVHEKVPVKGHTNHMDIPQYKAHGRLPLTLQAHNQPLRFRNIWIRDLEKGLDASGSPPKEELIQLPAGVFDRYIGHYGKYVVERKKDHLSIRRGSRSFDLFARTKTLFASKVFDMEVDFQLDQQGRVTGLKYRLADWDEEMHERNQSTEREKR